MNPSRSPHYNSETHGQHLPKLEGTSENSRLFAAINLAAILHIIFFRSSLGQNSSEFGCLIYEILFIKELRPGLNTQSDSIIVRNGSWFNL